MLSDEALELLDSMVELQTTDLESAARATDIVNSLDITDLAGFGSWLRELLNRDLVRKSAPRSIRETVRYYVNLPALERLLKELDRDHAAEQSMSAGVMRLPQGSVYTHEGDFPANFGGPGDIFLKVDSEEIPSQPASTPASDCLVSFQDNPPERERISEGLFDLREAVRSTNDLPVEESERTRLLDSLRAAETLWKSSQLKVIQIKVGVIMAVEDAGRVLAGTAKGVAAALLVDAIKAFVKTHAGLDLDQS